MPDLESVDAVIIGTGQAGKPLASDLANEGWTTVIIEKGRVGGTCIVDGCTPTKAMVASARIGHLATRASDYGFDVSSVNVDMERIRARKRAMVDDWVEGAEKGLARPDTLELVRGIARFAGPLEVEVRPTDAPDGAPTRRFRARHVFVNAGGRPRIPDIPGLRQSPFLTSASIMELADVPRHLIVLGGGYIGLEFAQMFRRFGAQVSILEATDRIATREDPDVAEALAEIFEEDGIEIHADTKVVRVEHDGAAFTLVLQDGEPLHGSHLLVATGREPNTDLLALDAAGLETDDHGFLPVDDRCRTAVDDVWGLGDVTGAPPFTHIAFDDYRVVRSQLLGDGERTREGRMVPYTLFTDPQLGRIGMTETEARSAGHDVRVATLPMTRVARAIETGETRGLMKAVVDQETDLLLGAAILGVDGGEVAAVLQTAMMGGLTCSRLRDAIYAHPTLSESLNNLFMATE